MRVARGHRLHHVCLARCAALGALALAGCRRPPKPPPPAPAATGRWSVEAARGVALRLDGDRVLVGALRRTAAEVADAPYPARPLVAAAEVRGQWRFAAADGTIYAAPTFLGPLTVVASAPVAARPLDAPGARRAVLHRDALAYLGADGRAWSLDRDALRPLPLAHVVDVLCLPRGVVLAITSPGSLLRSVDGGAHFAAVPLRDEAPLTLALEGGGAVVTTTRRRATLGDDGSLVDATAPRVTPDAPMPRVEPARWLPDEPQHVAALGDGTLLRVEGDTVRRVDPMRGATLDATPAPGQGCAVYAAHDGPRLVCTHEGWARAVYAPATGGRWSALRDELRAEPMGDVAFDDASALWVVAAPCQQRPLADPTALCVYHPDGRARPVHAPFAVTLTDLRGGAALLVARDGTASLTRGAVLRGEAMSPLTIPAGPADAAGARWSGGVIAVWSHDATGALVLHRATLRGEVATWRRDAAPDGAVRGVTSADALYAIGRDGASLWRAAPDGGFTRMHAPVRGDPSALPLDPDAPSYCAGAVCRFAGVLEHDARASGDAAIVTRADPAPEAPSPWQRPTESPDARPFWACAIGAPLGPGPELDRGAAVSGYALQVAAAGPEVRVTWTGDELTATTRARWPADDPAAALVAHAPGGATAPVALLTRCAQGRCDARLATSRGLTAVALPTLESTHRTDLALASAGRVMALQRGTFAGRSLAQATLLDASTGAVVAARTMVSDGPPSRILPGVWGDVDGLWLPVSPRRWRFVALSGEADEVFVDDPGVPRACAPDAVARGVLRRIEGASELRGDGWSPADDEWQIDEVLAVTDAGPCVRALSGGESRDESSFEHTGPERDPVRSFSVTPDTAGRLVGTAWQGRRRFALTCAREEGHARRPRPDGFAR